MIPIELKEAYYKALFLLGKLPGLNGVEIGLMQEDHEFTDQLALQFRVSDLFLRNKHMVRYAHTQSISLIPGQFKLSFNTLKTSVNNQDRVNRLDPIQPGISVGCFECGTLGMMVTDGYTGNPGFITCYHVISGRQGIAVTQPGPGTDGGSFYTDIIGNLVRFIPYGLNLDAAFIQLNGLRASSNEQFETRVDLRKIDSLAIGDSLTKSGRTTGVTSGKVVAHGSYTLNYPFYGYQTINGSSIQSTTGDKISDEGDSGAIWYDNQKTAKGLHFATDETGQALACNLPDIFSQLNIKTI